MASDVALQVTEGLLEYGRVIDNVDTDHEMCSCLVI
jgi:hypothetical protein